MAGKLAGNFSEKSLQFIKIFLPLQSQFGNSSLRHCRSFLRKPRAEANSFDYAEAPPRVLSMCKYAEFLVQAERRENLFSMPRRRQETSIFFEEKYAEIAQLVEHDLAKVGVASSSLVFRSTRMTRKVILFFVAGRVGRRGRVGLRGRVSVPSRKDLASATKSRPTTGLQPASD